MSTPLTPVSPAKPPAPWLGGKRMLAPRIARILSAIDHDAYAEPFVGMGGVFFVRPWRPEAEFINDVNQDLVTLFRVLQRHYPEFVGMIRWRLSTRADFERLKATDPATLTDLERAARFLYLQRMSFGGKVAGQTFGLSNERPGRFDVTKLAPMLEELHERLAGVTIENLPYPEFITRYDRPGTCFYLDPPYWDCETDYGKGVFGKADFRRLAEILRGLKGAFLLSINDVPEIREIFAAFAQRVVSVTYTIGAADSGKRVSELLITNRPAALDAGDTDAERQTGFQFGDDPAGDPSDNGK